MCEDEGRYGWVFEDLGRGVEGGKGRVEMMPVEMNGGERGRGGW